MWATFLLSAAVDEVVLSAQLTSSEAQVRAVRTSGASLGIHVPGCKAYGIGAYGSELMSRGGWNSSRVRGVHCWISAMLLDFSYTVRRRYASDRQGAAA
ncbi:hypothetical protein GCM10022420_039900 [Streptomyces iranensis]